MDHFQRLGLPRRFDLSDRLIEEEFLKRSRETHPDYHQDKPTLEQRGTLELSSALNESYQILKNRFRRADYLLQLEGGPTASEVKEMPQIFLMEMLEIRERIEEVKIGQNQAKLESIESELEIRRDDLLNQVGQSFESISGEPSEQRKRQLLQIRQLLNATKYIENLLRDLRD